MNKNETSFKDFLWKSVATQMFTYMVCGLIFYNVFNYSQLFKKEGLECFMRSTNDPQIALGPLYQVFRGLLFGVVLFPFWNTLKSSKKGWLHLWGLFLGLSIFGVCSAAPGSLEGFLYTNIPMKTQLLGLPEIIVQTFLFSTFLIYWDKNPKRYINNIMIISVILIAFFSISGYLATR